MSDPLPISPNVSPSPARSASTPWGDHLFRWLCRFAGFFVVLMATLILVILVQQSWPVLSHLSENRLLTSTDWNPAKKTYGSLTFIYGTFATAVIAMLLAVPLGVGSAAFLSEIAPKRLRKICSFLLELLAAIPSVVYGFWAKIFLAPIVLDVLKVLQVPGLQEGNGGQGILAAGLVLSIMVLPYITALSYDICQAVPRSQREGALALGSTRWQTISRVVLPYARPGIIAACFLGLGRAIGETMAVTMVIGNASYLSFSPAATGDTLPSVIAKGLREASGDLRSALMALGLILFVITLFTNVLARVLLKWMSRPPRSGTPMDGLITERPELPIAPPPVPAHRVHATRRMAKRIDRFMTGILTLCQILTIVPLFLILGFITYKGAGEVNLAFFTQIPPPRDDPGGLGNAVVGSLILVSLATVFAVPIGVLAAISLTEYRNQRFTSVVRFVTDLLSGVPSIIIGVFGYSMLVFPFWLPGHVNWRFSAWAGSFALGVMMLPVVIRAAEEAMKLVPNGLREASYALGASQRQTVMRVILPAALPAILTGILLAVGRIAGETAPLLLTSGSSNLWPASLGSATPAVPYFIYDYSKNIALEEYQRLGWAAAFVLLVSVLLLNITTRLVAGNRTIDASRAA